MISMNKVLPSIVKYDLLDKEPDIDVWKDGKLIPVLAKLNKQMLFCNEWAKISSSISALGRRYFGQGLKTNENS